MRCWSPRMPRVDVDPLFARALVTGIEDRREQRSTAANAPLMNELAQLGGGVSLSGDPQSLTRELDLLGSTIIEYRRQAIWDRPGMWGLVILLLAAEWRLRRRWGGV